ncbi:MAG: hypothetical protein NWR72_11215 [Bacteroidia bacterium]|nr:hypothetical protein [Bacteroidia bacterium]
MKHRLIFVSTALLLFMSSLVAHVTSYQTEKKLKTPFSFDRMRPVISPCGDQSLWPGMMPADPFPILSGCFPA